MPESVLPDELTSDTIIPKLLDSLPKLIDYEKVVLSADSNLVEFAREHELLTFEFRGRIEEDLNVILTQAQMMQFFFPPDCLPEESWDAWEHEVMPTLTVSALADFILEHAPHISFEPVSILGSPPCPAAGYFVGMRDLATSIRPDAEWLIGPSTPIRQVLSNSDLQRFWRHLGYFHHEPLPSLRFNLQKVADGLLIVSCLFLFFGVFVDWAFLAAVWLICMKGISIGCWLRRRVNPLPRGIATFGDLARYLTTTVDS